MITQLAQELCTVLRHGVFGSAFRVSEDIMKQALAIPHEIISDRGTQFTSAFFREVSQCLSSSCQPQSDGQTECANHMLEDMLRHFVRPGQDDWDVKLPCCDFAINNVWSQANGSTPFFLNFGEHPRSPISADVLCKLPAADTFVGKVRDSVIRARKTNSYAQTCMCPNANAKQCAEAFEVGKFGKGLPASMSRIHPVFHVLLLRKYKDGGRQASPPPAVLLDGEEEREIQQVLAHRGGHVSRSMSLTSLCHGKAWGLNTVNGLVSLS